MLVASTLSVGVLLSPSHAHAAGIKTYNAYGVDTCVAPTVSQMQNWWTNSPYWHWYIYIGGVSRGCAQPNLSASWVTSIRNQGWGLMPIWVGLQAPCTNFNHRFSYTPMTAFTQGKAEADGAYNTAVSLGISAPQAIVLDVEPYTPSPGNSCEAAVESFVSGWVYQLHLHAAGEKAGLYGGSCGSHLETLYYATSPRPDWIWGADPTGNSDAQTMTCVGSTHWTGYTRHKQYTNDHNEVWGGLTIQVDNDCAYGPMYANQDRFQGSC